MAEDAFKVTGLDLNDHPFWNRIYNEPAYKEELFLDLEHKLSKAFHTHEVNNNLFLEGVDSKE